MAGSYSKLKKQRRERLRKAREKKKKKNDPGHISSDSEDERQKVEYCDKECDATSPRCKRPRGTQTWITCDTCEGQYHLVCIKMTPAMIPEGDFECRGCRDARRVVRSPPVSRRFAQVKLDWN